MPWFIDTILLWHAVQEFWRKNPRHQPLQVICSAPLFGVWSTANLREWVRLGKFSKVQGTDDGEAGSQKDWQIDKGIRVRRSRGKTSEQEDEILLEKIILQPILFTSGVEGQHFPNLGGWEIRKQRKTWCLHVMHPIFENHPLSRGVVTTPNIKWELALNLVDLSTPKFESNNVIVNVKSLNLNILDFVM